MQIQVSHSELTPLVKVDYDKLYNDLGVKLTPDEMIFARRKAGFGGVLQWDLPSSVTWTALSRLSGFERTEALQILDSLRRTGMAKLGSNRRMIECVYSVPSADWVYAGRDDAGHIHVMLAGWGYRYPNAPALDPLTWHPEGEQDVKLRFISAGATVPTEIDLRFESGSTKRLPSGADGDVALGQLAPGTMLRFTELSSGREFSFAVEKGRGLYLFDVTPAKEIIPHVEPDPVIDDPVVISPEISIRLIGYDGRPVSRGELCVMDAGLVRVAAGVGSDGMVRIDSSLLAPGVPFTAKLSGAGENYGDAPLVIDEGELDYEIHYHSAKSGFNGDLWFGILFMAATLALTIWALIELLS